jgi:hypothetical protein
MKRLAMLLGVAAIISISWGPMISLASSLWYVDSGGNIGVGNTDPQSKLDISGAVYSRLVAASSAVDWSSGNVQAITLSSATTTLTFSDGQAGGEYTLIVNQDGSGGRAAVWPNSVFWENNTTPTLTTTPSTTDVMHFVYDGSHYLGSSSLNHSDRMVCDIGSPDASTIHVSYWIGSTLHVCYSWVSSFGSCDTNGGSSDTRDSSLFTGTYSAPSGDNIIRYKDNGDADVHDFHYNGDTHVVTDPDHNCS